MTQCFILCTYLKFLFCYENLKNFNGWIGDDLEYRLGKYITFKLELLIPHILQFVMC